MQFLSSIILLATTVAAIAIPEVSSISEYSDYTVEQTGTGFDLSLLGSDSGSTVTKRGQWGLYACVHSNFNSPCTSLWFDNGQCYNMPGQFFDSISSIGPSPGVTCNLYDNTNCDGNEGVIQNMVNPGFWDLQNIGHPPHKANWGDCISSYRCWT